jgi:hypothetical protein
MKSNYSKKFMNGGVEPDEVPLPTPQPPEEKKEEEKKEEEKKEEEGKKERPEEQPPSPPPLKLPSDEDYLKGLESVQNLMKDIYSSPESESFFTKLRDDKNLIIHENIIVQIKDNLKDINSQRASFRERLIASNYNKETINLFESINNTTSELIITHLLDRQGSISNNEDLLKNFMKLTQTHLKLLKEQDQLRLNIPSASASESKYLKYKNKYLKLKRSL